MDRTSSTAFFITLQHATSSLWGVNGLGCFCIGDITEVTVIRICKMVHYLYHGVPVGQVIEIKSEALKWSFRELRKHGRQVMQFIIVNCQEETIYCLKFCAVSECTVNVYIITANAQYTINTSMIQIYFGGLMLHICCLPFLSFSFHLLLINYVDLLTVLATSFKIITFFVYPVSFLQLTCILNLHLKLIPWHGCSI